MGYQSSSNHVSFIYLYQLPTYLPSTYYPPTRLHVSGIQAAVWDSHYELAIVPGLEPSFSKALALQPRT